MYSIVKSTYLQPFLVTEKSSQLNIMYTTPARSKQWSCRRWAFAKRDPSLPRMFEGSKRSMFPRRCCRVLKRSSQETLFQSMSEVLLAHWTSPSSSSSSSQGLESGLAKNQPRRVSKCSGPYCKYFPRLVRKPSATTAFDFDKRFRTVLLPLSPSRFVFLQVFSYDG